MTKMTKSTGGKNAGDGESLLHQCVTYLVTLSIGIPFYIFMKFFSRSRVFGKEHLNRAELPFLFVSNHVSMLDDAFIGSLLFLPRGLWDYKFMPYHTPERKNFYRGPIFSWIMEHAKCLPLTRGKGIFQPGIQRIIEKLKTGGCVHIYPEGTRTRTGKLGKGQPGVGRIVFACRCGVIPCYHSGLSEVLPIGNRIPKIGKRVNIIIGEPFNMREYFSKDDNINTYQSISDAIIAKIAGLKEKLDNYKKRRH